MPASSCARSSAIHARQAERDGEQPGRLRREVGPRGVGAAHDRARGAASGSVGRGRTPRPSCRRCRARRGGSRTRPRCRTAWRRSARRPPRTSDGAHEQEDRVRDRRSGGSARGRRCGRSSAARGSPRPCGPRRRAAAGARPRAPAAARPPPRRRSRPRAISAAAPACRSQAATPSLSFRPCWQTTTTAAGRERPAPQSATPSDGRRRAPGISRGSAAKSSSVRTSMSVGRFGRPTRRASLSTEMVVG